MHITIVAIGSRGDVQPFVALGVGLEGRGHRVRIATYRVHSALIRKHGLEFAPIEGNPRELMQGAAGQAWMTSGKSPLAFYRGLKRLAEQTMERSLANSVEACNGTEAIIYTILGTAGYHLAEKLRVPRIFALLQPFSRTRQFPGFLMPGLPLGGRYNLWTHILGEQLLWQLARKPINRWRRESLELDAISFGGRFGTMYEKGEPFIYGFSEHVVPRASDWPTSHHVTGYWFLNGSDDWTPPHDLVEFIASGTKPIYIGFGSMTGDSARRLSHLASEAATLAGQRAVLVGGWAGVHDREFPDCIYPIESVPHDWLFPQMAAVVHHGGAGTTAAGLRAGVPTIVTPFFSDQPFWGRRVHGLGVGPKPISQRGLTPQHLADVIAETVGNESMDRRAESLGKKIRAEDGVARAVKTMCSYLER